MRRCPNCGHNFATVDKQLAALGVTPLQKRCLDVMAIFIDAMGFAPTYGEIAYMLDLKSKSQAHRIVEQLIERGYLTRLPWRKRCMAINERFPHVIAA